MKWLFVVLFIFGSSSTMATYGASDPKQKRIYRWITIITWAIMLILANVLLTK
jgi:hypothetical protein